MDITEFIEMVSKDHEDGIYTFMEAMKAIGCHEKLEMLHCYSEWAEFKVIGKFNVKIMIEID